MSGLIAGLTLGFSLIIAIGSQNAFVLKQGLKNEHVFIICFICALSDAILIILGIVGFSVVIATSPWVEPLARYGGAIFLIFYGANSFLTALKNESLSPSDVSANSLLKAVSICLAFTWLNPHVYLDTVVLIGSISSQYPNQKLEFAIGASLASFIFFFSLGYGAKFLLPIFKSQKSWKILDVSIGIIMWSIAFKLVSADIFS